MEKFIKATATERNSASEQNSSVHTIEKATVTTHSYVARRRSRRQAMTLSRIQDIP